LVTYKRPSGNALHAKALERFSGFGATRKAEQPHASGDGEAGAPQGVFESVFALVNQPVNKGLRGPTLAGSPYGRPVLALSPFCTYIHRRYVDSEYNSGNYTKMKQKFDRLRTTDAA
jgi:hypothetical protein